MKNIAIFTIISLSFALSGCSILMHSAPPREAWRQKGIEHKQCDFNYYLPFQDMGNALSIAMAGINAGFAGPDDGYGQTEYNSEYALVGVLLAAPFIASSIYGFKTANDCRDFRNELHYRAIHLSK